MSLNQNADSTHGATSPTDQENAGYPPSEDTDEDELSPDEMQRLSKRARERIQKLANERRYLRAVLEHLAPFAPLHDEFRSMGLHSADDVKHAIAHHQEESHHQNYLQHRAHQIQSDFDSGLIDGHTRDLAWQHEQTRVAHQKQQNEIQRLQSLLGAIEHHATASHLLSHPDNEVVKEQGMPFYNTLIQAGFSPADAVEKTRELLSAQGVALRNNQVVAQADQRRKAAPVAGGRDRSGAAVSQRAVSRGNDLQAIIKTPLSRLMGLDDRKV